MTRPSRELRLLYRDIPKTPGCLPGCSDCCGPVAWPPEERARIEADIPAAAEWSRVMGETVLINPLTGKCPFVAAGGGCTVYDRRPMLCRMFGAVDAALMACAHGCNAKRRMSERESDKLMAKYKGMMDA